MVDKDNFNAANMMDTFSAMAKDKISEQLNTRITGVRANKGAIIDNIALIYSDKNVVQIGGNGGNATSVYEIKSDEKIISVTYSEAGFSGYSCIGMVEFLTNSGRKITLQACPPNKAKMTVLKAPAGMYIHSLKGTLAGNKYVCKLEIDEARKL